MACIVLLFSNFARCFLWWPRGLLGAGTLGGVMSTFLDRVVEGGLPEDETCVMEGLVSLGTRASGSSSRLVWAWSAVVGRTPKFEALL